MEIKRIIRKVIKWYLVSIGVLFNVLLLTVIGLYVYYEYFWQEWSPARIERITGARVPQYEIIEYHEGTRHYTGDFEDKFTFEFKTMPSDEMFDYSCTVDEVEKATGHDFFCNLPDDVENSIEASYKVKEWQ